MIPQSVIDRIVDLDIVSVIRDEGIELKKSGATYTACCPFHNEKTPSFHVSASKNIFKCFGCGKGGGVITFIMEFKGMQFLEAVEYLADKHHIDYEKRQPTPEEMEARSRKENYITSIRWPWSISAAHQGTCGFGLLQVQRLGRRPDFGFFHRICPRE